MADIPLENAEAFDAWLRERWYEKDAIMEQYVSTGRLPASSHATEDGQPDYIETEVRTRYPWEILQVFSVVGTCWILYRLAIRYFTKF